MSDIIGLDAQILADGRPAGPAGEDLLRGCDLFHASQHNCQIGNRQDGRLGNCRVPSASITQRQASEGLDMPEKPRIPPEMWPDAIGRRLTTLRVAYGLKPSEIADLLGIERPAWTRFEKGQRQISDEASWALVQRFGVTLDWIMLGRMDKLSFEVAEKLRAASA